jgi:cysteine-rich repeat protein
MAGRCEAPRCGDGILDDGEECDDGDRWNTARIPGGCRPDCVRAYCGDGVRDPGEECDDGPSNADAAPDACRTDCRRPRCGDGTVDTGEGCDDGEANSDELADACRTDCREPFCGDGVLDSGEDCDDAAAWWCAGDCSLTGCGGAGQRCCPGEAACSAGECISTGLCMECGGDVGEACCPTGRACAESAWACASSGRCESCGELGQVCCGDGDCDPDTVCGPDNTCVPCGDVGELCCYGGSCAAGGGVTDPEERLCFEGVCRECGARGEPCCGSTGSCDADGSVALLCDDSGVCECGTSGAALGLQKLTGCQHQREYVVESVSGTLADPSCDPHYVWEFRRHMFSLVDYRAYSCDPWIRDWRIVSLTADEMEVEEIHTGEPRTYRITTSGSGSSYRLHLERVGTATYNVTLAVRP